MTEAARQANVILPASSFAEKEGSLTSSVSDTKEITPAVASPIAWDGLAQVKALAADAGTPSEYKNIGEIKSALASTLKPGADTVRLAPATSDSLLRTYGPTTNALMTRLMRFAEVHGLKWR